MNETAFPLWIRLRSSGKYALVDACDYEWVCRWSWGFDGRYARRREHGRKVYLHIEIARRMGLVATTIDHKNVIPLDDRRENLRGATKLEQSRNRITGKYGRTLPKGVNRTRAKSERWSARIRISGQELHLGSFGSIEEASKAYNSAVIHHFGEFAHPNAGVDLGE